MTRRTSTTMAEQHQMVTMHDMVARIPGHGSFTVTADALAMIGVFGGFQYCHQGKGCCSKQGLYFSRTEPKKSLRCLLTTPASTGPEPDPGLNQDSIEEIILAVSHELAPRLDGAVLDFGNYNKMQRFIWSSMPAATGPRCVCRRSMGTPAGKRSPCIDDQGIGLSDP